ncbi:MBL fold metallo-hydrolase [Streptomyces sp. SID3343]|uniref:MBL fold metallo-hydrolase n=1 Tax=Streptomyces sp. SID3343 TaxID=2690260 RepID=UPI00136E0381|nr:MBL fold metallo-hydrolase [Streptomyces sp. SID3343]MYW05145.1 MBL fold metallo-hydrolase [Streptomyces sp. SID3343]
MTTAPSRPTPRVADLGNGVWTVPVPIPDNPLGVTLVYVLETEAGPVLVDAGWDDPISYQALVDGLIEVGTTIEDVHGVLVTHAHPDHHGLSEKVREASGAWIALHAADAEQVDLINNAPREAWLRHHLEVLTLAGAPQDALDALTRHREVSVTRPRLHYAVPDRELVHGELAPAPGRAIRTVWTPGHTPGHVCLHLEDGDGRLLSGDHLLPSITPHIGLYDEAEEADPLGDFLASLTRVAQLPITGVLPAHEHVFSDAAGRAAEVAALHEERLSALRTRLCERSLTLWQIAEGMDWNRPWAQLGAQNRQLALSEAAAHLRHLVKRGRAQAEAGGGPARYTAL